MSTESSLFTKFGTIDGFLGPKMSARFLEFALLQENSFAPTRVTTSSEESSSDRSVRRSWHYPGDLGEIGREFRAAISDNLEKCFSLAGLMPIADPIIECDMAAHRDGCFFTRHIDTFTDETRKFSDTDRLLSAVYYFYRQPSGFSGGELAIAPIRGDAAPQLTAPLHDRLVVFPSFTPHAVLPVSIPGDAFSNARFSVNCWIRRARTR
ncbi:hypothetical protein GRI43_01975 [Altererythrobacter luteolus]|uniref:Fe2OG dioxygenase domain-containing protein n=1 Tax=Pontixanthobacter luteolus TaxID=295089 RepID=A0A6I4V021_9SPHN|nr:hypothetical protein [Pontixanthobacter luteolus]